MHTTILSKYGAACWLTLVASCGTLDDGSHKLDVAEPNDLGVVSIVTDRVDLNGDAVFELRGLDAAGEQVALVRERTGDIADLSDYLPGGADNFGSEIVVAAAGNQVRSVSREIELHQLSPVGDPAIQGFLELGTVSATLAREANIVVLVPQRSEVEFSTYDCYASEMNASPVAKQCCLSATYSSGTTYYWTTHVNPSNAPTSPGAAITRYLNPYGTACKASNGTGACNGAACYYGPNGFSRPSAISTSPYWLVTSEIGPQAFCEPVGYSSPQTPVFPDVTGTFATGQGCPGSDGGGGDALWDY